MRDFRICNLCLNISRKAIVAPVVSCFECTWSATDSKNKHYHGVSGLKKQVSTRPFPPLQSSLTSSKLTLRRQSLCPSVALSNLSRWVPATELILVGTFPIEPTVDFTPPNIAKIIPRSPFTSQTLEVALWIDAASSKFCVWAWRCARVGPTSSAKPASACEYRCPPSWLTNQATSYSVTRSPPLQLPENISEGREFSAKVKRSGRRLEDVADEESNEGEVERCEDQNPPFGHVLNAAEGMYLELVLCPEVRRRSVSKHQLGVIIRLVSIIVFWKVSLQTAQVSIGLGTSQDRNERCDLPGMYQRVHGRDSQRLAQAWRKWAKLHVQISSVWATRLQMKMHGNPLHDSRISWCTVWPLRSNTAPILDRPAHR